MVAQRDTSFELNVGIGGGRFSGHARPSASSALALYSDAWGTRSVATMRPAAAAAATVISSVYTSVRGLARGSFMMWLADWGSAPSSQPSPHEVKPTRLCHWQEWPACLRHRAERRSWPRLLA